MTSGSGRRVRPDDSLGRTLLGVPAHGCTHALVGSVRGRGRPLVPRYPGAEVHAQVSAVTGQVGQEEPAHHRVLGSERLKYVVSVTQAPELSRGVVRHRSRGRFVEPRNQVLGVIHGLDGPRPTLTYPGRPKSGRPGSSPASEPPSSPIFLWHRRWPDEFRLATAVAA